jgi:hypothetical protein
MATIGVHDAGQLVERARKLVHTLESGDGRSLFSDLGYGEGDHAQGQRVLRNAERALEEAKRPPTAGLRLRQYARAAGAWADLRREDLRRDGLKALAPRQALRHGMDLLARLRAVARGGVANEELENAAKELKEWLDRWGPIARKVAQQHPELAERLGVYAPPPSGEKPAPEQASA